MGSFQAQKDCKGRICILRQAPRQVDIFAGPTDPARLGNSHYSVVLAVQLQPLSYHVLIGAEMPSPKLITEHHHRLRLLPIDCIRWLDTASKQRWIAKKVKGVRGYEPHFYILWEFTPCQRQGWTIEGDRVFHDWRFLQKMNLRPVQGDGFTVAGFAAHDRAEDAIGVLEGIGIEKCRIDHAEDRCGGSDSERQREESGQSKDRAFDKLAECVSEIPKQHAQLLPFWTTDIDYRRMCVPISSAP
jgi:hypothetical protein